MPDIIDNEWLKYDSLENWKDDSVPGKGANLILRNREIGVCFEDGDGSDETIMFKVGDGKHTFSELPWSSGLLETVNSWARINKGSSGSASSSENYLSNLVNAIICRRLNLLNNEIKIPADKAIDSLIEENGIIDVTLRNAEGSGSVVEKFLFKSDTSANWEKKKDYVPELDEMIIYSDLYKIKFGDGVKTVKELQFAYGDVVDKVDKIKSVDVTTDIPSDDSVVIWIDPEEDGEAVTESVAFANVLEAGEDDKSYVPTSNIVQNTGDSTTNIMSQKAVSDELNNLKNKLQECLDEIAKLKNS